MTPLNHLQMQVNDGGPDPRVNRNLMPKKLQSQWEFTELLQPEPARRVYTVTELTGVVRRLIESQLGRVWVTGEITNWRRQSSGHAYFSIKDGTAQLQCVLFRGDARGFSRDLLEDGQKVTLHGEMTVYEGRGQYQLRVTAIELQGVGALQAAFEKLKQKLGAEGLFSQERKRPLPRFPQRIGLVTSPTGAALRDVLHVFQRRHPGLHLILAASRVQGSGASEEVAAAIRILNEWSVSHPDQALDLILVTRGGGSLEDLWAFNEEIVARAIFHSSLPIITAIGHEIDFTIADFVADFRAATPSAAAEILTEGMFASRQRVGQAQLRMRQTLADQIDDCSARLDQLNQRLYRAHPKRRLRNSAQRVDDLVDALRRCGYVGIRQHRASWQSISRRWVCLRPSVVLERRRGRLALAQSALHERLRRRLKELHSRLSEALHRLRLLSPENTLARGYSITTDARTGRVIRSSRQLQAGQTVETRLHRDSFRSVVTESHPPKSPADESPGPEGSQ